MGRDALVFISKHRHGNPRFITRSSNSHYNRSFSNPSSQRFKYQLQLSSSSYARHSNNSSIAAWGRHRRDASVESVMSSFSGIRLGCPGFCDKTFNTAADHGPLTSISASPSESARSPHLGNRSSFASIIYDKQRSFLGEDSLSEKTNHRSSISSDSMTIINLCKMVYFLPTTPGLFLLPVSAASIV